MRVGCGERVNTRDHASCPFGLLSPTTADQGYLEGRQNDSSDNLCSAVCPYHIREQGTLRFILSDITKKAPVHDEVPFAYTY